MDNGGQTLYVHLKANLGDLRSGLVQGAGYVQAYGQKVDATFASMERNAKKNQAALRSIGTIAGGAGLLMAAGIGVGLKKFAEFDQQMSSVQAATHASKNEMAALREEAIKLGADTAFSATEAGQGIEELAKAGIETHDILNGALKGSLDLAAAGDLSVAQAAEIAATAKTQFDLLGSDVPHLADLLAAGAGKAQGSVQDLGAALGQTGLVAGNMGLSIEDTTGTLAAFASAGLIGSDAGTSFKTMIQRLQAPMGRGAKAMEQYGISAYDAEGNFVGITEVAGQLTDKLGGLDQQTRDAALAQIFGADAIRAATVLYKQGSGGIQEWIDKTNDQGYAAETAALRTDNLMGDIERLGGSLDSLFIGMGAGANGPMREVVQLLESLVDIAGSIPGPVMSGAVAVLALSAAFGGTVFAATRMLGAVGQTRANMSLLKFTVKDTAESLYLMDRSAQLKNLGKAGAVMAGAAVASGVLGDEFEYTNTVALGLMGIMGGPIGVAVGAGIGAFIDGRQQTAKFNAELDKLLNTAKGLKDLDEQTESLKELSDLSSKFKAIEVGDFGEEQAEKIDKTVESIHAYRSSLQVLEAQTTGYGRAAIEAFNPEKAERFAQIVGPVLEEAGLKAQEVFEQGPSGENWGLAVAAIKEWKDQTETAAGRAQVLEEALAGVDDELLTSAEAAEQLSKALEALLSPNMDLDAAVQTYRDGLIKLREELAENGTSISNNTVAGRANREAIRGQIDALTDQMVASAEAGKSSEYLGNMMSRGRDKILDTAEAAGINRSEMRKLLNQYNLTPEMIETLIKQRGAENAKDQVKDLGASLGALSGVVATPEVKLKTGGAAGVLSGLAAGLNALDGKNVTSTITTKRRTVKEDQADGGFYPNGVPAAADGLYRPTSSGLRNDAHMQRAGISMMRYAEAETQGESFIPHSKNKRGQSTKILSDTAGLFGYDLAPRGMSSAGNGNGRGGTTTIIHEAPLVGSLAVPAMPGQDAAPVIRELTYSLRRIQRGGKYNR